jgi:hypothetical protein
VDLPGNGAGLGEGTLIVTESDSKPSLNLHSVAPQPCNPEVEIRYSVARAGEVKICLYNVQGSKVHQQSANAAAPGEYGLTLQTSKLASGVYILSLEVAGTVVQRPLTVLK